MSEDRKPMANITPFGLRMQPELKARVEAAAKQNNRSINAEIVERLESAFTLPVLLEALTRERDYLEAEVSRLYKDRDELAHKFARSEGLLLSGKIRGEELEKERAMLVENLQRKEDEIKRLRDEADEMRSILQGYASHFNAIERLEGKVEQLTRGLAVYGRAFEMSVGNDQVRGLGILDKAIDEIDVQNKQEPGQVMPRSKSSK